MQRLSIHVRRAGVIRNRQGADHCFIEVSDELNLRFDAPRDKGPKWLESLGFTEYEVIEVPS